MTRIPSNDERLRRWRLILGGDEDGTGCSLQGGDAVMDAALGQLYDADGQKQRWCAFTA